MGNYLWIIDAGHGGIDSNGNYTTAPNKMHIFEDAFTIYEGVINRKIAFRLETKLKRSKINFTKVYDPIKDTSLGSRVRLADIIFSKNKNAIYLSIHSNAGGGSGFEIFTSRGQTKSDKVANIFCEIYKKHFPRFKFRQDYSDGDADKEEDFYVLRKSDCPALLVENLFFDNRQEAEFLSSEFGQELIANCIFDCIKKVEELKPI